MWTESRVRVLVRMVPLEMIWTVFSLNKTMKNQKIIGSRPKELYHRHEPFLITYERIEQTKANGFSICENNQVNNTN